MQTQENGFTKMGVNHTNASENTRLATLQKASSKSKASIEKISFQLARLKLLNLFCRSQPTYI